MKTKTIVIPALVLLALAITHTAINTRLGAHIILDVLGGGEGQAPDHDPATGPLVLTRTLKPLNEITLPQAIEQPSGIQHRGDTVYISTDQTELFVLDADFKNRGEPAVLLPGPLLFKQGSLEAIEYQDNKLYAIGEFGALRVWENTGNTWQAIDDAALPASIAEGEFSGITMFDGKRLATSEENPVIVDLDTGETHSLDFGDHLKPDADPADLQFSGLAQENSNLYILTETHSSILVVDPSDYTVTAVFGITPAPVADLAVRDRKAYVVVDHNYNEPRPPVYVYDLSEGNADRKIED